jgi:hypothetical protein
MTGKEEETDDYYVGEPPMPPRSIYQKDDQFDDDYGYEENYEEYGDPGDDEDLKVY